MAPHNEAGYERLPEQSDIEAEATMDRMASELPVSSRRVHQAQLHQSQAIIGETKRSFLHEASLSLHGHINPFSRPKDGESTRSFRRCGRHVC